MLPRDGRGDARPYYETILAPEQLISREGAVR